MINISKKIATLPSKPGVYFFKNKKDKIIYIGKSVNLKARVKSYFQNKILPGYTRKMVNEIADIDYQTCFSEFEALLLEAKLINKHQPFYNVRFKDDKSYLLIAVSQEDYPRIYTTRKKDEPKTLYYGPFISAGEVKRVIKFVRKIFPFRSCKRIPKKACLYYHLGLCPGCCFGYSKKDYKRTIKKIVRLLSGDTQGLLKQMEKEMKQASRLKEFEKAAELKKQIDDLTFVMLNWQSLDENSLSIILPKDKKQKIIKQAKKIFPNLKSLKRIEGYDISNLYGRHATGSMVVFEGLKPAKEHYRRFKIRKSDFPDDVGMIYEVINRRIKHKDWNYPDLMVIDGGRGQVSAANVALRENKIKKKIYVLGLAKPSRGRSASGRKEELIIKPVIKQNTIINYKEIRLKKDDSFLRLLQNLRNESHRFAKKYHLLLRKRKLR